MSEYAMDIPDAPNGGTGEQAFGAQPGGAPPAESRAVTLGERVIEALSNSWLWVAIGVATVGALSYGP